MFCSSFSLQAKDTFSALQNGASAAYPMGVPGETFFQKPIIVDRQEDKIIVANRFTIQCNDVFRSVCSILDSRALERAHESARAGDGAMDPRGVELIDEMSALTLD